MHRTLRDRARLAAPLVLLALAGLPALARAWGSTTHHYIAQHYSQHLPGSIDGLRAYDATVDAHVTDADTRKPVTPGESYKHYIDIDVYPEFLAGTLTHSRSALEAEYGASAVLNNGVVPWAIGDAVTVLAAQFAAADWANAALTIADLCHYVADATQPLHCAQNYDGQLSGNNGIHSRYETTMMGFHIADLSTPVLPVAVQASPVDAAFDIVGDSWADVAPLLAADTHAKSVSGGAYNATYYTTLWTDTQAFTRARIDTATVMTASLVTTAWVLAGRPSVPGSSASVALLPPGGRSLAAGPTPFRGALDIRFAGPGPLAVDVYDVRGARVAHLADGVAGAGNVAWRPGANGGRAAAGLYFVRLSGSGWSLVRRVTLLD